MGSWSPSRNLKR